VAVGSFPFVIEKIIQTLSSGVYDIKPHYRTFHLIAHFTYQYNSYTHIPVIYIGCFDWVILCTPDQKLVEKQCIFLPEVSEFVLTSDKYCNNLYELNH